jgi:GH15 family glucan-1,4-alpha-glucosidase
MPSRIEDYAIIGDLETAALVSKDGSIDWLCWPRFDSPACLSALLGDPENGRWQIAPAGPVKRISRHYRPSTLVLETEFETDEGNVTVIDFMPPRERHSDLVRLVRGTRGQVKMTMELLLRFDYGSSVPWVHRLDDGTLRAIAGPNMVAFRTTAPIHGENLKTVSDFTVREGETVPFVMTYRPSYQPLPRVIDSQAALAKTERFWRTWCRRSTYRGPYSEAVERSLITLKAMTYWPTGGILAAVTTSLPEKIGGERNWDYRYCWIRDAALSLWVLMGAGYYEEAAAWQDWLLRAVAGSPSQVQIMYGLAGERQLTEMELKWLSGFENSKPVRIGNAASEQFQLDLYGEIAGVLHQARSGGLPVHEAGVALEWRLLEHLESVWREPDEGIWEVRGGRQQFTHSKAMAWLAFDYAIKSCEQFGLKCPAERWTRLRQEIHDDVCHHGFDPEIGSFVQSYGSKHVDANLLMLAKMGFLPPTDPRIIGTVHAIETRLLRNGLILRYDTEKVDDGLPPGEGAFLACTFWLIDNYLLLGRHEEAKQLFERLISLRNDVGLLAEEFDVGSGRMIGNFPQAFSHVALVNSALNLTRKLGPSLDGKQSAGKKTRERVKVRARLESERSPRPEPITAPHGEPAPRDDSTDSLREKRN